MGGINIIIKLEKSNILFGLITFTLLSMSIVNAESIEPENFNLSISVSYFNEGYPINIYTENMTFDGVSFEITGINPYDYKITNISVLETNPESFINTVNFKYTTLKANEKKVLAKTSVIPISNFNESKASIILVGYNDITGEERIGYGEIKFNSLPEKNEVLSKLGDKIWKGNSIGGLYILGVLVFTMIFIFWKYNLFSYPEYWRKKSKYKRMNRGKL